MQRKENPTKTIVSVKANFRLFSPLIFQWGAVPEDTALGEPDAISYLIIAHLDATMEHLGYDPPQHMCLPCYSINTVSHSHFESMQMSVKETLFLHTFESNYIFVS